MTFRRLLPTSRPPARTGLLALAGALLLSSAVLAADGTTTVTRTILDRDRDNRLELAPGERHVVRNDLGQPAPNREARRRLQLSFWQLTDSHIVDEESPLRVEFLDKLGPPLTSAYRPHEGLSPQVQELMVRQIRETPSPTTGRRADLVMTTGDNSDNTQLNEVRWFIDLLDGGRRIDPNSGVPGTCGTVADGHLYDGVRGGGEYYEPDRSGPPNADVIDGPGYAPYQEENQREAGRSNAVRDFPGLFESMNRPFRSTGLDLPWYGIFGNHDGLVQGNQPRNPGLEALAVGCVKVRDLSPAAIGQIGALAADGVTVAEQGQISGIVSADVARTIGELQAGRDPGVPTSLVPSDARRRPLKKVEYIAEHFNTAGRPLGHGFTEENRRTGQGYYAFAPRRGLRFLVLDSISEAGGSDGNIDDTQFRWIHQQLLEAARRRELVMAFAHHSLRTMNQPPVSGFSPGDQGGDASPLVHFGVLPNEGAPAPCAIVDPATPPTPDETLRCLFLRHRGMIAFVVGHEHVNRIVPNRRSIAGGQADGGFWEITTASHIDWPQQSRLLDLFDNRDGTLSIFGTIIDHAAAPDPGGPAVNGGAAGDDVGRLASISRELSYNDPDAANGEDGQSDARGTREDRNVELLIKDPYPRNSGRGGPRPGPGRDDDDRNDDDRDDDDDDDRDGGGRDGD